MGKLYVVGFGPGGYEHMTVKAVEVIKKAGDAEGIFPGQTLYRDAYDAGSKAL